MVQESSDLPTGVLGFFAIFPDSHTRTRFNRSMVELKGREKWLLFAQNKRFGVGSGDSSGNKGSR